VTAQWEDIKDDLGQITYNLAYTQRLDSAIAIPRLHALNEELKKLKKLKKMRLNLFKAVLNQRG
jgi:hypothetical protein